MADKDRALELARTYNPAEFKMRSMGDIYSDARRAIADKYNAFMSHPVVEAFGEEPLEMTKAMGETGWELAKMAPGAVKSAAQYVYENPSKSAGHALEFGAGLITKTPAMVAWGPGGILDPSTAHASELDPQSAAAEHSRQQIMAQEAQMMRDENYAGGYAEGGATYPVRHHIDWEEAHDYEKNGAHLTHMSPDEFLDQVKPLNMDDDDKDIIQHFKEQIEKRIKLDPLAIKKDGKPNGRHRAIAAKEAGVKKIPVVTWQGKERGGTVINRAIMLTSKKA
jgi:hypothetical protein